MSVWDLHGRLDIASDVTRSVFHNTSFELDNGIEEHRVVQHAEDDNTDVILIQKMDDIADGAINSCCFHGLDILATGSG